MSSKWNNSQTLQKTPKVCKKPPLPLPFPAKQFFTYPLQCFATWRETSFAPLFSIAGFASMPAGPTPVDHFGVIGAIPYEIEVLLHWNNFAKHFLLTVNVLKSGSVIGARFATITNTQPTLPFSTDLINLSTPAIGSTVYCRIFS